MYLWIKIIKNPSEIAFKIHKNPKRIGVLKQKQKEVAVKQKGGDLI